jgi:hypothetical protein
LFSKISYLSQKSIGDRLAIDIQPHAGSKSGGHCAKAIRQSIERVTSAFSESRIHTCLIYESAGTSIQRIEHAKDYGQSLQAAGFRSISNETPLRPGDVRSHQSGHIQMYTGSQWVFDFKQNGPWPGPAYRKEQSSFQTYRLRG